MKHVTVETSAGPMRGDLTRPLDLSIPLQFGGPQPSHFGAPTATATPVAAGSFVGDVRRGGSCNCEEVRLVPHCNGTHTECLGHVTAERVSVHDCLRGGLYLALVFSVSPVSADTSRETSDPAPKEGDRLITAESLAKSWKGVESSAATALVVRTLPNESGKRARHYKGEPAPAYFSREAAELLVTRGIEHLLVDLPSIDRTSDEGKLTAHRIFWGLPAGSRRRNESVRPLATVTELIYVADSIADGLYLLDLQLAPFVSDAAPSRPLLYALEKA